MPRALRLVTLAALLATAPAAAGGVIIAGYPSKLHGELGVSVASVRVNAIRWIARNGRTSTQTLPRPALLSDLPALTPPAGEWTDVTLILEGATQVKGLDDGRPFTATLNLDTWTVPLEQPVFGGATVHLALSLNLPAHLGLGTPAAEARLQNALQDGALLVVAPCG